MSSENGDGRDEGAEGVQDDCVSIAKCVLGRLMFQTGESVEFEDYGDFVVVCSDDLNRLRALAVEVELLACED